MVAPLIASLLMHLGAPKAETWYGPVEVKFDLHTHGNPYDPGQNDVEVAFQHGAHTERRLAFFDGNQWRCRLLTETPGDYSAKVWLNGKPTETTAARTAVTEREKLPFVREAAGRFWLSDGKPFWPIGHSLAWTDTKLFPMLADQLPMMGRNGVNWTRIWATYWDGRNPYWVTGGAKLQDGYFSQDALEKWDTIARTAESSGVYFQWTLHHHGQVSSTVNPNWQDHPWNVKNGGFLQHAEDFFTDAEAKRRTKAYLRYVVARYADSPAIMAWELFNEVQFSDAAQKGHWDTVAAWHAEMAAYLRSIDPYHHLITTSSEIGQSGLFAAMDYYQAHGYPASIQAMVLGDKHPTDKPYFWGEVGGPNDAFSGAAEHLVVRDAIWSGVLAGNAGSAEYWNWDRVLAPGMYDEYKRGSEIINASGFLDETGLSPRRLEIQTEGGATLKFSPGLGWAASQAAEFNLPQDATPVSMGRFSSFLQGRAHPDMSKPEVTFNFTSPVAGSFRVHIAGVSASGSSLAALVDGAVVKSGDFAAGSKPDETWTLPYSAGAHTVVLRNTGEDWVVLGGFEVDGIAPSVVGSAIANDHFALMRLTRTRGTPAPWAASGLPLRDGEYIWQFWDLDTGKSTFSHIHVRGGKLDRTILAARDEIMTLRKL